MEAEAEEEAKTVFGIEAEAEAVRKFGASTSLIGMDRRTKPGVEQCNTRLRIIDTPTYGHTISKRKMYHHSKNMVRVRFPTQIIVMHCNQNYKKEDNYNVNKWIIRIL